MCEVIAWVGKLAIMAAGIDEVRLDKPYRGSCGASCIMQRGWIVTSIHSFLIKVSVVKCGDENLISDVQCMVPRAVLHLLPSI